MRKRMKKKKASSSFFCNKPQCLRELDLHPGDYVIYNWNSRDWCCEIFRKSTSDDFNSYLLSFVCSLEFMNEDIVPANRIITDEMWLRRFTKEEWEIYCYKKIL